MPNLHCRQLLDHLVGQSSLPYHPFLFAVFLALALRPKPLILPIFAMKLLLD